MTSRHILKTTPDWFRAVWSGSKTFEIRLNDRNYQAGDEVLLREFDAFKECGCPPGNHAVCKRYSGREIEAQIGCVIGTLPGTTRRPGFDGRGYVVFSLVKPEFFVPDDESKVPTPLDVARAKRGER